LWFRYSSIPNAQNKNDTLIAYCRRPFLQAKLAKNTKPSQKLGKANPQDAKQSEKTTDRPRIHVPLHPSEQQP
jgi:hypothetical protein